MQLAAVIGTYGLSLLVIMISSAPTLALRQKDKIGLWSSLGLIIAGSLLIGGYGVFRLHRLGSTEDGDIKVRIVQPAIPQTMKWSPTSLDDNINKYIAMPPSWICSIRSGRYPPDTVFAVPFPDPPHPVSAHNTAAAQSTVLTKAFFIILPLLDPHTNLFDSSHTRRVICRTAEDRHFPFCLL